VLGERIRARSRLSILAVLAAFVSLGAPTTTFADHEAIPITVYVPETGHTADLLFLDAWRSQRELIGNPITEEFKARAGFLASATDGQLVQFFQNMALVWVPDAPVGEQIQPLPLGEQALKLHLKRNPGEALLRADRRTACPAGASDGCRGFARTGQTVRGEFYTYWLEREGDFWLGAPLTEAFRAPDRSLIQYFERGALRKGAAGSIAPMPIGSVLARQHRLDTAPIAQPEGVPVFDDALFVPPDPVPSEPVKEETGEWVQPAVALGWVTGTFGPGPQVGGYKEIVISISKQAMWAYEDGALMASTLVSTGTADIPETVTPIGYHTVLTKYEVQTMQGVIGGEDYLVEDVPHILYFDDLGNALHGAYWHNEFGAPRSHGCVNLPLDIAEWLYNWAPIGTAVTVVP
jgi:hypothetical protein